MASLEETSKLYREGKINYPQWLGRSLWGGVVEPTFGVIGEYTPDYVKDELAAIGKAYDTLGLPKLTWGGDPQYQEDFDAILGLGSTLFPMARGVVGMDAAKRGMTPTSFNVDKPGQYSKDAKEFAKGTATWGLQGMRDAARMMFSPTARAKYAELGINPFVFEKNMRKVDAAREKLRKAEESGDPDLLKEARADYQDAKQWAHQQLQATANIRTQASAQARGYDLTEDAMTNAVDTAASLRAGENFWKPKGDKWYDEIIAPSRANAGVKNYDRWQPRDSDTVQRHILNEIKKAGGSAENTRVVVKNSNKISGAHQYDLFNKNTVANGIARAFKNKFTDSKKRQFSSPQELHRYLTDPKNQFDAEGNRLYYVKFDDVKTIDADGGVWVTGSTTGSAKVEGAVNTLYKVYPDGRITASIADMHDFFENVPVVGQTIDAVLPSKVVAVTPPLHGDIWDNPIISANRAKNRKKLDTGVQRMETPAGFDYIGDLLDDIRAQKPSMKELLRQYGEVGLNTLPVLQAATGGTLFGTNEDVQP